MRFTQLQSFLAVAESGGVRTAAQQLGVSQPTLTKALRLLEQDLGVALFARGARGMTLTDAGRLFLTRARTIQAEAQRAREELSQLLNAQDGGALGVGLAPSAAMGLAPQAVVALRRRWPRATVRIVDSLYPNVLRLLREHDIDVALGPRIGPRPEPHSDIAMQPLLLNEACIAARRGHPRAQATSLRELVDDEWLRSGPPGGPATVIERAFLEAGLPLPKTFVQCESFLALPDIVANSDVVAIVPVQILQQHGARAGLVQVRVGERLAPTEVSLLTRAGEPHSPLVLDFIEIVRALVAKGFMNCTAPGPEPLPHA